MMEPVSFCNEDVHTEDYYDFIVENYQTEQELREAYPDDCVERYSARYAFLHVKKEKVRNMEQYGYTAIPKLYGLMDTSSVEETGAFRVHNQPALNVRGQGVIIGFIDTGIAFDLDIFRYEDGTTRLIGLWDQELSEEKSSQNELEEEISFLYGTMYSQEEINQALREGNPYERIPSRDTIGHGTFLAGIAAGRKDDQHDFEGMAPEATIAMVKLRQAKTYLRDYYFVKDGVEAYSEIDILNGVKYLLALARVYRKPLVICIGLGTNQGGHDGTMPFSAYLSNISLAQAVAVVQAAGNEGNARRHYLGRTGPSIVDAVEIKVAPKTKGFSLEIWGSALSNLYIGLQSPSGDSIAPTIYRTNEVRRYPFLLDASTVYVYDRLVKMQEGDYLVLLRFETPAEGIWTVYVADQGKFSLDYHMWMPIQQFTEEETYFLQSNPYTTLVSNACAANTINVGMYQHLQDAVVAESSKGFTRNHQVKPDILAPGVDVYGPAPAGNYVRRTGTSIAAAHTAGAAALLMEYGVVQGHYSYMDGADIKGMLIRGARRNPDIVYPNETYGYGFLDIYEVFRELPQNI